MNRNGDIVCALPRCQNELDLDDDLGICPTCSWRIAQRYRVRILAEDRAENVRKREARIIASRKREVQQRAAIDDLFSAYEQPRGVSFVYYVRIGEYIKIGYSSNLLARLAALRAPVDNLLALEFGGRDEEQQRHRQFDDLRVTRRWENFRPEPDLLAHIESLREKHGLPKWLQSPRRGKNGPVEVRRIPTN